VGNNGETLVADSSASTGLRYNPQNALVNPVINGGMDIWQRGTSFTAQYIYTADRWFRDNQTGRTFSRQTTSDTTNLPNIQYALRCQRDSGSTNTVALGVMSSIETVNSIPFAGKTVTLSFYARKGANFTGGSDVMTAQLLSGTGTDQRRDFGASFTGEVQVVSSSATLTSTWQRFAYTGTVGATATELAVAFYYTPSGTASTNDWLEVTGAQIDFGTYTASTAPTFRRSGGTIQGELAACQRYYYRQTADGDNYQNFGFGMVTNTTTAARIQISNPVTMRSKPSSIDFASLRTTDYASGFAVSALTFGETGIYTTWLTVTMAAGTAFRSVALSANNTTAAYVGINAEL
jgi:hypothetical protein